MISFAKKISTNYIKPTKVSNQFLIKHSYAIFSKSINFLSIKEIESARIVLTRSLGRVCNVDLQINKSVDITRKNLNMRMGKGRGKFFKSIHPVIWGSKILSVTAPNSTMLNLALKKASKKLSCKKKLLY